MRVLIYSICVTIFMFSLVGLASGQVQPQLPRKPVVRFTYDGQGNVATRTVTYEYPYWEQEIGLDTSVLIDTGIIAYPNPTFGPLNAEAKNYSGEFPLRYEIYNNSGVLVRTVTSMHEVTDVSLGDNLMGSYVLKALRGDSVIAIKVLKVN